jgi:hypothetical protein
MNIILLLLGGSVIGLASLIPLLLPYGDRYTSRGTMIIAALLHALPIVGFFEPGAIVILWLVPISSFLLILHPVFGRPSSPRLVRPVLPAIGLLAANSWSAYICVLTLDPAFMGAQC